MSAFTPGPWGTHGSHIYAPDGEIIAVVHNPGRSDSDYPLIANRDLMAAAPDLLEALQTILYLYCTLTSSTDAIAVKARDMAVAAIARAEPASSEGSAL